MQTARPSLRQRVPDYSLQGDKWFTMKTEPLEALIARVWSEETSAEVVAFRRVVHEYVDIFPDELLGLPPYQEI